MYKNIELCASVMCFNMLNAREQLIAIENCGIDYLHFDVADGRFVKDFTMGSALINTFRDNTHLKTDYHLMVEEPSTLINTFSAKENDIFVIHQEACRNLHRDLMNIKKAYPKTNVGVALSPGTIFETLEYIIEDVDVVLLMMVDPGYKGQPLVPQTIRKIKKLRELIRQMDLKTKISVDGCVNEETVPAMVEAGADILVLGSSGLLRNDYSIQEAVQKIHNAIDKGLEDRKDVSIKC